MNENTFHVFNIARPAGYKFVYDDIFGASVHYFAILDLHPIRSLNGCLS
jgi:hypothetical protein